MKRKVRSKLTYEESHKMINGVEHKLCRICEIFKPMNIDYFYKQKSNLSDGFDSYCKECTKAKAMSHYNLVKETDDYKKYKSNWYQDNRDRVLADRKIYRRENKKRIAAYTKWYQENHKEKMRGYQIDRKKKKHRINKFEWEECKSFFNNACAYCGLPFEDHKVMHRQDLHKEHVIHEGRNDILNCVPSCRSCNSSKHIYSLNSWYNERHPYYSVERYLKIYQWIRYESKKIKHKHRVKKPKRKRNKTRRENF